MSQVVLDISPEILVGLRAPLEEAGDVLRMAAAVKLYELKQLSSGAAARLAGILRVVFLARLADYGVDTFQLTASELKQETRLA